MIYAYFNEIWELNYKISLNQRDAAVYLHKYVNIWYYDK